MFRRLKVRLGSLTWKQIRRFIRAEQPIVVRLRLTDAKGGPLCGAPGEKDIRWEV